VTVAVLDTGVDASHPDLEGKVAAWAEFDGSGSVVVGSRPHDTDRHGTHVCGTIAGGGTSGRWIGVAPEARLAVGLVLDGARGGTDAQVLAGLDWALESGAGVVSLSLGGLVLGPQVPSTYTRAFLELTLHGVPVVCAAGPDGAETTGAPGGDPTAFTVGATDVDDLVAGFSAGRTHVVSRSEVIRPELLPLVYAKPDLTAPGVAILSCIPGGGWACLSGTSMATPHVAGALALLLSGAPALATLPPGQRAAALTDALVATAAERGERGHDHRYGLGRLDVLRALGLAREPR
jgi:subtilisin family serine protease